MKKIILFTGILMTTLIGKAQLSAGESAPEIALPDVKDSIINLSSFKGKIVLIDFWASWCLPCRAANPGIVKLYKKYRAKGFEVYGVSLDVKKAGWIKAIKQDKITYTQVIDDAGWFSKIAELYLVNELPTNFLLDAAGKIIAVNAEGADLEKQIKMLLN